MTGTSDSVLRILLVTLSNIGDAIMTTPVMEALHAKYPKAQLDIVTDPRSANLFAHCPYRGKLYLRDKQLGWRGTLALLHQLRQIHYDLVVDLRTDGLAWLLHTRRRLTRWGCRPAGSHAVERHMAVIARRENISGIPPVCVWLSSDEHRFASETFSALPGTRWLALAPGARWESKRWPVSHFIELAGTLQQEFDALLLVGSKTDAACCRELAEAQLLPCLNLAGKTTLLQTGALLQHTRLFVGNDSGPGHLAAAAGIPTLTLFGPGDPQRYHPWNPQGRWLQSTTGRMVDLSPDAVARNALEQLAGCAGA
ncbi:MAG: glycosyltransferase family 9 protein [Gammaproteobacteria bacterium]|nr:MAG: glycosyltransferase family 9 protein [Gammaproteobacteria bacterium]